MPQMRISCVEFQLVLVAANRNACHCWRKLGSTYTHADAHTDTDTQIETEPCAHKQTETHMTHTHTHTRRPTQLQTPWRDTHTHTNRQRGRQADRDRQRQPEADRDRQTETDRRTYRQTETGRKTQRDERHREAGPLGCRNAVSGIPKPIKPASCQTMSLQPLCILPSTLHERLPLKHAAYAQGETKDNKLF